MIGSLIPQVRYIVTTPAGVPIPFAQIRAFLAGSSTPQNLYTDADLMTPLSIPVLADGNGLFPAMFSAPVALKIEISNAAGVLMYSTDNVNPPNLLTGTIATDQASGHAIGPFLAPVPGKIGLAIAAPFTLASPDIVGTGLYLSPEIDATAVAASLTTLSALNMGLLATLGAAGTPNVQTSFITAPLFTSGGSVPARAAIVVMAGMPAIGTERYGLLVSQAPVRFGGAFVVSGTLSPTALAANTDNWAPTGIGGAYMVRIASGGGAFNLTGIDSGANGNTPYPGANLDGRQLLLVKIDAGTITIVHDATSSVNNRFLCPGSANFSLTVNNAALCTYDAASGRWRVK